jgi:hypothetical protein
MSDIAQLHLQEKGKEARLRAVLEDMVEYHKGVYENGPLALAVWFNKSVQAEEHCLLELFKGLPMDRIVGPTRFSLLWRRVGSNEPPFVLIDATSVEFFEQQLASHPPNLANYFDRYEILYFDKNLLPDNILAAFNILSEPPGLIKGWYVTAEEYAQTRNLRGLLTSHGNSKPQVGLVKMEESQDFENCRGILNVEIGQKWLPISPNGIANHNFYNDTLAGHAGHFLFQGGSFYQILKFEIKTAPEYSARLLERSRDDRYPEVYLRAVRVPDKSAP